MKKVHEPSNFIIIYHSLNPSESTKEPVPATATYIHDICGKYPSRNLLTSLLTALNSSHSVSVFGIGNSLYTYACCACVLHWQELPTHFFFHPSRNSIYTYRICRNIKRFLNLPIRKSVKICSDKTEYVF
jgi:hypothetical protein